MLSGPRRLAAVGGSRGMTRVGELFGLVRAGLEERIGRHFRTASREARQGWT